MAARDEESERAFLFLLEKMGDRVEYLFKEDLESEEPNRWLHISGGIHKDELKNLIKTFEEWFFTDSAFQFCIREPDIKGYFAYDEHGIFFIYDKDEKEVLRKLGIADERRELLTDKGHWHVRPKDAESTLPKFKVALKETSVFCEDEAEQKGPADSQTPS